MANDITQNHFGTGDNVAGNKILGHNFGSIISNTVNNYSDTGFIEIDLKNSKLPRVPEKILALAQERLSLSRHLVISVSSRVDSALLLKSILKTTSSQLGLQKPLVKVWQHRFEDAKFSVLSIEANQDDAVIVDNLPIHTLKRINSSWWKSRPSTGYILISIRPGNRDLLSLETLNPPLWRIEDSEFPEDSEFLIGDDLNIIQTRYEQETNPRVKLLHIALACFAGLEENQFFASLEEVFEQSWTTRVPQLHAFDYDDFFGIKESSAISEFIDESEKLNSGQSRFNVSRDYRQVIFSTAWRTQRRQILSMLPVLVNLVKNSIASNRNDLYPSESYKSNLREVIAESISNIVLLSAGIAEDHLLALAASPSLPVQMAAAQSLANWRALEFSRVKEYTTLQPEKRLLETLEKWYSDAQDNSRIRRLVATLMQSEGEESFANSPEDQILSTVALCVGLSSRFDNPNNLNNHLLQIFCNLASKVAEQPNSLLRVRFFDVTLPYVLEDHLEQLAPSIKRFSAYETLVRPIASVLIKLWYNNKTDVDKITNNWIQQSLEHGKPSKTNHVALTLFVQSVRTIDAGYEASDLAITLEMMFEFLAKCTVKSDYFKRLTASFAIINLVSRNFSSLKVAFSGLISRLVQPQLAAQLIGQIYIQQRSEDVNGDFSFHIIDDGSGENNHALNGLALPELDPLREWAGVDFQGYVDNSQRVPTEIEIWLFDVVNDDSNPQLQCLAIRALSYLYNSFDKFEAAAARDWQPRQDRATETTSHDSLIPVSMSPQVPFLLRRLVPRLATLNQDEYYTSITNTLGELYRQQFSFSNSLSWVFGRLKNSPNRSTRLITPSLERAAWLLGNTWLILLLGAIAATFAVSVVGSGIYQISQLASGNRSSEATEDNTTSSPMPGAPMLSADEARVLIGQWLQAKARIFAPPYDSALLESLAAGSFYEEGIETIQKLRDANSYYSYGLQEIRSVRDYSVSGGQVSVVVEIAEDKALYEKNRVVPGDQTQFSIFQIRYTLEVNDGRWKLISREILNQ
ncbi:hypothetical protein AMR42_15545 [Limnothrix sp. PR1529]|uniref:ARC6/PARC6 family protein n=1 Tax=Limnothrix sp. PR1529 TaxID=1704291 RepID=UPI00081EEE3E|nr:ARC6/PARC6 family protein [Limnothrix sp. PR1529]OCQ96114.1 hypothetical protein BCR12_13505 [Limnothrix sp. P13C2]PIB05770.1 hypothetical protein AMR42_15545 [Limnothrix sp. PR1529]